MITEQITRLREAAARAQEERDGADAYSILADTVWDILDAHEPTGDATIHDIARAFHESYERQAPEHSYRTRKASAVPWEDVPANNKRLMVAVVIDLLRRGIIEAPTREGV